MRRHTIAIIGLCTALFGLLALPGVAGAREKKSLPGAMVDAVSRPLDTLFGSPRKVKRRSYHRRSHSRRPAHIRRAAPTRSKRAPQQAIITPRQQETSKPAVGPAAATAVGAAAAANAAAPESTITPAIAPALPPEKPTAAMNRASQARATTAGRQQKPQPVIVERNPLGYVGLVSWPNAFEDVIGYIFWPRDYEQRLRNHGFGDIIAAVFRPARPPAPPPATRRGEPRSRTGDAGSTARAGVLGCSDTREPADWPGRQIEQAVQLDDAQRAKLAELRTAIIESVTSIRAACRDEVGLVPPDRMMVVQATLWAVRDAAVLIRDPLQAFYDSLSDEQRAKFLVKDQPAAPATADARAERMRTAAMARPEFAARLANSNIDLSAIAACGETSLDWPSGEIDDVIKPDAAQRASLESLQNSMIEMGQFLALLCPRSGAETPLARLDAATERLTAMIFAASTVNLALNDFYGLLTSEQKARIAPPTR